MDLGESGRGGGQGSRLLSVGWLVSCVTWLDTPPPPLAAHTSDPILLWVFLQGHLRVTATLNGGPEKAE